MKIISNLYYAALFFTDSVHLKIYFNMATLHMMLKKEEKAKFHLRFQLADKSIHVQSFGLVSIIS